MSQPPAPPRNYGAEWDGEVAPPAPLGEFTVRIPQSSCLETAFLPGCVRGCSFSRGWTVELLGFRVSVWSLLVT